MNLWLQETFELSQTEANVIVSLAVVVLLLLIRVGLGRLITRGIDDTDVVYRSRKIVSYVLATFGVVILLWLWIEELGNLGTFLGLAIGGLAIAMAEVLRNVAGWMYIVVRSPYRVDDRIEIDGVIGDVIDIKVFQTLVLEIGNWVDADQSTGRIVHIPNAKIFHTHVFNSTEAFGYLWHEISLWVTYESDWRRAEQLMQEALDEAGAHTVDEAEQRIEQASKNYKIRFTYLTPTVYLSADGRGVKLTGRILVDARRRRAVDQQVWRKLLDGIREDPNLEIAYPTTRTYLRDPLRITEGSAASPVSRQVDPADGDTSR